MSNFRIECPYCNEYNEYNFKICKRYSNYRKVKCDKCNLQFEINAYCEVSCSADSEELKKVIPKKGKNILMIFFSFLINPHSSRTSIVSQSSQDHGQLSYP